MSAFDLPLAELRVYDPEVACPEGFDDFWTRTLREARFAPALVSAELVGTALRTVEVRDVVFRGFGGDLVRAWYLRPAGVVGRLPVVVEFAGYGGGRGKPQDRLFWSAAGYAHVLMDTRGQGGDTPDPHGSMPSVPGFMTRGIQAPEEYYYRRVYTDAVRCVDAVRELDDIDPARVVVAGMSQGGGIALAAAGLRDDVAAALVDVPFLCHFARAVGMTDRPPYAEITRYLAAHRDHVEAAYDTLAHVDGVNFAARATAPALFSVGLHDATCPPSTVFAAYNAYARNAPETEIAVYPHNDHEGGGSVHWERQAAWLASVLWPRGGFGGAS